MKTEKDIIKQNTPWDLFWNSLTQDEKTLFRLLQRTHRELGSHVQMFYLGHLRQKQDISDYVLGKFGIDLENLPRSKLKEETD